MHNVVLIAHPDPQRLEAIADLIAAAGANPLVAHNGSDALATAFSYCPQVVVLAADLPEVQGTDVCLRLKQDPATQGIAVILLADDPSAEERFVMEGVAPDELLVAPIDDNALLDAVRQQLARVSR